MTSYARLEGAAETLGQILRNAAEPLPSPESPSFASSFDRFGDARIVLLGEATHGTREFYRERARVTRRLIEERGLLAVAVEGDWPDAARVNRYVRGIGHDADAREALLDFRRFPSWMWRNTEVVDFVEWLRGHNDALPPGAPRVGFYGLDVYSLWDSLHEVMAHLRRRDPDAFRAALRALHCFEPYAEEAQDYARSTLYGNESCREEVIDLLTAVRATAMPDDRDTRESRFVAEQNALVVKNAEAYYRTMVRADNASWNIRDRHMAETLDRLLVHHGRESKAIVWAHNTHIGDARATDMADDGMINVGQLAREAYGEDDAVLVGFGTHRGTVIAGDYWDAPWKEMRVPAARENSWEDALHRASPSDHDAGLAARRCSQ